MVRFKADAIIVRKCGDLQIIFYDSHSIYLFPDKGTGTIFHRWFAPRGSYGHGGNWDAFRKALLNRRYLSMAACFELAATWDIQSVSTNRRPNLTGKKVAFLTDSVEGRENSL